jgi:hypothetical protein
MHVHQNGPHKPQIQNGCQWHFISLACCDEVVLNNSAAGSPSASLCMCKWLHGCHKCATMCETFEWKVSKMATWTMMLCLAAPQLLAQNATICTPEGWLKSDGLVKPQQAWIWTWRVGGNDRDFGVSQSLLPLGSLLANKQTNKKTRACTHTHTHTKGHIAMWLQFLEGQTTRMTTSYRTLWMVMKAGSTNLIPKQNDKAKKGIKKCLPRGQSLQPVNLSELSSRIL